MMDHNSLFIFFTNHGYTLELLYSMGLFCHFLKRKKHFILRSVFIVFLMIAFSLLWNLPQLFISFSAEMLIAQNIIKYLVNYVLGFLGILFCFESRNSSAMFCMACAMATQHLSYRIYACIQAALGLTYSSPESSWIVIFVSILVYVTIYYIFVRRMKLHPELHMQTKQNNIVGLFIITTTILLHFMVEAYVTIDNNPQLFILLSGYNIICCIFTLMIEHGLLLNNALTSDKEMLERMLVKQEEQYHISKANIDMINIKCHDMKHQISRIASMTDQDTLEELDRIVSIYDSNLQTGNNILDVCLMEKKLLCERNNIKFDCIANGACLSFLRPSDIFSLFGNAMENAIEASCKVEDERRRIIALTIREQLGMVVIHLENNYDNELIFANGLPRTTKADENYHGFGVRSIQMVAEKYDGTVVVLAKDGIFNLNISIPIPEPVD